MPAHSESVIVKLLQPSNLERSVLDAAAIDAVRCLQEMRAASTRNGARRRFIIRMLNESLATELVCELRFKRHAFTAEAQGWSQVGADFLAHANAAAARADRLAQRIGQLGGEADFSPAALNHSRASYDDSAELDAMIRADLMAEHESIDGYSQFISQIGDKDNATRDLLEDILVEERGDLSELERLAGALHADGRDRRA